MKPVLPCSILLVLASATHAQNIPNGNFEDWTNTGNYLDLTGWRTSNWVSYSVDGSLTCEPGSPGAVGAHFVKVTDRYLDGMGMEAASIDIGTQGLLWPGFPFSDRPEAFNGQRQYHPVGIGTDGVVAAVLTRWNPDLGYREVIANAPIHAYAPIMSWEAFSVPFLYYSDLDPDTANVQIIASQNDTEDGTSIWVDDLSFGEVQGVDDLNGTPLFDLSPSPASDVLRIDAGVPIAEVILQDMSGRTVSRTLFTQVTGILDVKALPAGMYLANVRLTDGRRAVETFMKD